ncbi:MAG: hypothetical protein ABIH50_02485 [bacterium]
MPVTFSPIEPGKSAKPPAAKQGTDLIYDYITANPVVGYPDFTYFKELIESARLTNSEIKEVLSVGVKGEGVNQLWTYALLKKTQKKHLLSPRYQEFQQTMVSLLRKGKIKVIAESNDRLSHESNAEYLPQSNNLKLNLTPGMQLGGQFYEEYIIHELFHASQDYKKRTISQMTSEAEAYLAAADYLFHRDKEKMANSWIKLNAWGDRNSGVGSFTFGVPRENIKNLVVKKSGEKEFQKQLAIVRKSYQQYWVFRQLYYTAETMNISKEIVSEANNDPTLALPLAQKIFMEFNADPRAVVSVINIDGKPYSQSAKIVKRFLAATKVAIASTWMSEQSGKPVVSQSLLDEAFTIWQQKIEPDSMGDKELIDPKLTFDGIQ